MRHAALAACVAALLGCGPGRMPASSPAAGADDHPESPSVAEAPADPPAISFVSDVQPILERCRPCHFEGGKMYDKLPFDSPDTIRRLGPALFTRIKDEREQAIINAFLDQGDDGAS